MSCDHWSAHGASGSRLPPLNDSTDAIAFSPDGHLLAATACLTASCPEVLDIWDVATGRVVQQLPQVPAFGGQSIGLTFSPDGRMLAVSSDDWVVLWNLASRVATTVFISQLGAAPGVYPLFPVNYSANVATFSPDGRTLAIGGSFWQDPLSRGRSTEGLLLVESATAPSNYAWNIQNAGNIADLAFSPDGHLLAETQQGGPVILRYSTLAGWQAQACAIANRNLTSAEWRQFVGTSGPPYRKTCYDLPAG